MLTTKDWNVLTTLFSAEDGSFRHHLGLARSGAGDFYAPMLENEAIRREKETILASAGKSQYLLATADGQPAFEEFLHTLGWTLSRQDSLPGPDALHRDVTLSLEPDWLLLLPPDWRLAWASVCFPTRWSLVGKALQPLSQIHAVVPKLHEELGRKIDLFFTRVLPGDGWGRANWGLSTSAARNQHPSLPYEPLSEQTSLERIQVRVESQHLAKLPHTGAIAFGIRIVNFPLAEVLKNQHISHGLKQQLRTMPSEVAAYKGIPGEFWRRL